MELEGRVAELEAKIKTLKWNVALTLALAAVLAFYIYTVSETAHIGQTDAARANKAIEKMQAPKP
jgi:hypothetical protein